MLALFYCAGLVICVLLVMFAFRGFSLVVGLLGLVVSCTCCELLFDFGCLC